MNLPSAKYPVCRYGFKQIGIGTTDPEDMQRHYWFHKLEALEESQRQTLVTGMATTDPEAKSGLSNPPTPQHTHAAPYYEACDKCYLPKSPPKVKEV